jgi:xanthine dehydrogenase accessory factor
VDDRPEFANKERFPEAAQVIPDLYSKAARLVPSDTFVVIVTQGHTHDELILREMARHTPPLPYIGMIGSLKKVAVAISLLKSEHAGTIDNIYAPIGLDIGGDTPGEIAVSIASELQGIVYKKEGLPHSRNRARNQ